MTEQSDQATPPQRVLCPSSTDPVIRMFILAAIPLVVGVLCFWDGYIVHKYPYKPLSEDLNAYLTWAFNYYLPYPLVPLGLIALVKALLTLTRKLEADETGIGYVGRGKIRWADVTRLDASHLGPKGLLFLHHPGGVLKLDSWKLKNFRELVAFIEARVPRDKQTLNSEP